LRREGGNGDEVDCTVEAREGTLEKFGENLG
jgi:hypothetical protein